MRISKLLSTVLVAAFLITPFANAQAAIPANLSTGSSGEAVTEVQSLLSKLGYFKQQATGYFGAVTAAAVAAYQSGSGLAAVGAVTPQTSTSLNSYAAFAGSSAGSTSIGSTPLTLGMTSQAVATYQQYLYRLGYLSVAPTGYFGALTKSAVMAFQLYNGLSPTGELDTHTQYLLSLTSGSTASPVITHSTAPVVTQTNAGGSVTTSVSTAPAVEAALPTRALSVGITSADVTALQKWLITHNFSIPAGATGYYGAQTQTAVMAYQRSLGQTPTGTYVPNATVAVSTPTTTGGSSGGTQSTPSTTTTTSTPTAGSSKPVPTVKLSVSDSTITAGASTKLRWSSDDADSCSASGAWSGSQKTSSSKSVRMNDAGTFTFTLTCAGDGGSTTQSVTVTVSQKSSGEDGGGGEGSSGGGGGSSGDGDGSGGGSAPAAAPTLTLTASPASVNSGGSSTISWASTAATACTASAPGWNLTQPITGSVTVPNITADQTYTITCIGLGGTVTKSVTVTVTGLPTPPVVPSDGKMKIGMNVASINYYGPEAALIDVAHTSSGWFTSKKSPVTVNDKGYITSWESGGVQTIVDLYEPVTGTPVPYVITYQGGGPSLKITGSGMSVVSTVPGRTVLVPTTVGKTNTTLSFGNMSTSTPITEFHMFRSDQESLFNQGELFNPDFVRMVSQWKTLRFMDWGDTNTLKDFSWSQRSTMDKLNWSDVSSTGGVPLELMVALCNEAHTEMWYNVPTKADDTYVRNAMTYIRDHLDPSLTLHVEYSNEAWNTGFKANGWMGTQAQSLWGASSVEAMYYGYRSAQISVIAHQVFGSSANTRLSMVIGTQDGDNWSITHYIVPGIAKADAGSVNQLFSELAIAPYFASGFGSTDNKPTLLQWANMGSAGVTLALQEVQHGGLLSTGSSVDKVFTYVARSKVIADSLGLKLVTYEGGPSMTYFHYPTEDRPAIDALYRNVLEDPRMEDIMNYFLNGLASNGVVQYNQFNDLGKGGEFGFWGAIPTLDSPETPRYKVLKAWAAANN